MKSIKRRGFTLVELLIVIVVIGVLAAMMMLSSTEAVSSAKANNVISNLRNIKTAVLSWYADNLDRVDQNGNIALKDNPTDKKTLTNYIDDGTANAGEFLAYLNNDSSIKLTNNDKSKEGGYILAIGSKGDNNVKAKKWYVGYNAGNNTDVQAKLAARASSIGLTGGADKGNVEDAYTGGKLVYMLILSLE